MDNYCVTVPTYCAQCDQPIFWTGRSWCHEPRTHHSYPLNCTTEYGCSVIPNGYVQHGSPPSSLYCYYENICNSGGEEVVWVKRTPWGNEYFRQYAYFGIVR